MVATRYHEDLMAELQKPDTPVTRYVTQRGWTETDLKTFRLGYAPPVSDHLTKRLGNIDGALPHALDLGLVSYRRKEAPADGIPRVELLRDVFHDRIMFPLQKLYRLCKKH